jgi:hypothetical protein
MELLSLHSLLQIYDAIHKCLKIVTTVLGFSGPDNLILLRSSVDQLIQLLVLLHAQEKSSEVDRIYISKHL